METRLVKSYRKTVTHAQVEQMLGKTLPGVRDACISSTSFCRIDPLQIPAKVYSVCAHWRRDFTRRTYLFLNFFLDFLKFSHSNRTVKVSTMQVGDDSHPLYIFIRVNEPTKVRSKQGASQILWLNIHTVGFLASQVSLRRGWRL